VPPLEEPRIWLTKEESIVVMAQTGAGEPMGARGRRGSDVGHDNASRRHELRSDQLAPPRGREYDDPPRRHDRFSAPTTSPRSNRSGALEETRGRVQLDKGPSFENRFSEYSQELEVRGLLQSKPRELERPSSYYDSDVSAPPRDTWDAPHWHRGQRDYAGWDRSADHVTDRHAPQPSTRARLEDSNRPLGSTRESSPYEKSHPSNRTNRERLAVNTLETYRPDNGYLRPESVRRGGSLLERLTLDETPRVESVAPQSLRARVEAPTVRSLPQIPGLPPRPSDEVALDAEMALDASMRERNKKRKPRVRRGVA
jgi:hypothetical protein